MVLVIAISNFTLALAGELEITRRTARPGVLPLCQLACVQFNLKFALTASTSNLHTLPVAQGLLVGLGGRSKLQPT